MRVLGASLVLMLSVCLGANAAWAQDDVGGCCDVDCCDVDCCASSCCPSCYIYGGAEAAFLKPHLGAIGFSYDGDGALMTPKLDYEASPRFWVGFENSCGLGVRATYWQIDASARQELPFAGDILDLIADIGDLDLPEIVDIGIGVAMEAETADVEVTQRGCLGCMEMVFAGGIRYGRMRTGLFVDGVIIDDGDYPFRGGVATEFEGVGPTLALDVRRPVGCNGLALVGGIRGAWLFGSTDGLLTGDATELAQLTISAEDHVMQTYEVNLGVEYTRCLASGCEMSVAALWESQVWEWAPMASLIHQDVGLSGPTVALSFSR